MSFLRYALPIASLGFAAIQFACGKKEEESNPNSSPLCSRDQNPYKAHNIESSLAAHLPLKYSSGGNLTPGIANPVYDRLVQELEVYRDICPAPSAESCAKYWNPTINEIVNICPTPITDIQLTDRSENLLYAQCGLNGVYYFLGANEPVRHFQIWDDFIKNEIIKKTIFPNVTLIRLELDSFPLVFNGNSYLPFMAVYFNNTQPNITFGLLKNNSKSLEKPNFTFVWNTIFSPADGAGKGGPNYQFSILNYDFLMLHYSETISGEYPASNYAVPISTSFPIQKPIKTLLPSTQDAKMGETKTLEGIKYSEIPTAVFSRYTDSVLIHGVNGVEFWFLQNFEIDPRNLPQEYNGKISRQPGVSVIHRYNQAMNYIGQINLPIHSTTLFPIENKFRLIAVGLQNLSLRGREIEGEVVAGLIDSEGSFSFSSIDKEKYSVYPKQSLPVFSPALARDSSSFAFDISSRTAHGYKRFFYDRTKNSFSSILHPSWQLDEVALLKSLNVTVSEACLNPGFLEEDLKSFQSILLNRFEDLPSKTCEKSPCAVRGFANDLYSVEDTSEGPQGARYRIPAITDKGTRNEEPSQIFLKEPEGNDWRFTSGIQMKPNSFPFNDKNINVVFWGAKICTTVQNDLLCFKR